MYIHTPEVDQWVMPEGAEKSLKHRDFRPSIACRGYLRLVGGVFREFRACLAISTPIFPPFDVSFSWSLSKWSFQPQVPTCVWGGECFGIDQASFPGFLHVL